MGNQILKIFFKEGEDNISAKYENLNQIPAKLIDGTETTIGEQIKGKKCYLVVNIASK